MRGCGGFRWRVADGGEPLLWCGAPLQLLLGSELPRLRILSHWRGFWGAVLPVLSFGRGYGGLAACRLAGVGEGLCAIEGAEPLSRCDSAAWPLSLAALSLWEKTGRAQCRERVCP